jgi:hypothetical protein
VPDHNYFSSLIWQIADLLRGPYRPPQYERTEHLDAIVAALNGKIPSPFVMHGRMSKAQRSALITKLDALSPDAPRVLLATGKLVGGLARKQPSPLLKGKDNMWAAAAARMDIAQPACRQPSGVDAAGQWPDDRHPPGAGRPAAARLRERLDSVRPSQAK